MLECTRRVEKRIAIWSSIKCTTKGFSKNRLFFKFQQEALSSISSAGQWAYTEYSSFSGPSKGE